MNMMYSTQNGCNNFSQSIGIEKVFPRSRLLTEDI